jgi:M3 family oligoendopeptidase
VTVRVMWKRHTGRFLALALIFVLICGSLGGCSLRKQFADALARELSGFQSQQQTQEDASQHACVDFSQMTYTRPDEAALYDAIAQIEQAAQSEDEDAVIASCEQLDALYTQASTQYALVMIYHSLDVQDAYYQSEYQLVYEMLTEVERRANEQLMALIEDGYRDALVERWGEEFVEDVQLAVRLNNDAVAALLNRDNELVLEYDRIAAQTSVSFDGRTWTLDDIYADDTLDYDTFYALYDAYCLALCEAVWPVFSELVTVRNQIAETLGFESYAQYQYLCYERDYTPQDALSFAGVVKEQIVPLLTQWYYTVYTNDTYALNMQTFESEETLAQIVENLYGISPVLGEAADYVRTYHLYDVASSDAKEQGAYTIYLEDYESPFLFGNLDEDYYGLGTMIHELGHCAGYYANPGEGPLDLAEIDSQGLELLSMAQYEAYFGRYAGAAAGDKLTDMLYSVVTGCMQDEFQQRIYAMEDLSMQTACQIFGQLNDEYGISELYPASDYEWVLVHHTFQSPFYYISYAASAVPALEIWQIAREDYDEGVQTYLALLMRDHDEDFLQVLQDCDLENPFDSDTLGELAEDLDEELARTLTRAWRFSEKGA